VTLPSDATPSHIEIITGDAQAGPAGAPLPLPLVVKVTDAIGRAVADQQVQFNVTSGGGQVDPATVQTGTDGRASATWTLGAAAGAQAVQAQAVGGGAPATLTLSFTATAVAGGGSLIAAVSGDDQTAPVNSALVDPLVVKVSDGNGNPVSGISVQWTAVGGGSVSPETVVTGADGLAATSRVLGPTAGQQSAQASAPGLAGSPVTFVQTAVPSVPTTLTKVSGDGQTAPAGFEVAEDLVVKLTDADGNGVGNRAVAWVVNTGGGTVNPQNTTTDPSGFATTRWTLGSAAGTNTMSAVFSGIPPVQFTATASNDVPAKLVLVSGDNQSAVGGATLANPLVVKVTDANDNPVENVSVAWTAVGGGSVSSPTSATNPQGLAQVNRTLGTVLGPYTTTADVPGLTGSPVTFTSTATVGPASQIAIITQPGGAANGALLSPQPVVQMQDAGGNNTGTPQKTITAALVNPPGGATLNGDKTKVTDAGGQAVFDDLNITGPIGTYTIRFTSPGLAQAVSNQVAITVGPVSAAKSQVVANPTTVAINVTTDITVTALDAGGNPVQGASVQLAASGNNNNFGAVSGPTDANGQATATYSSSSIGNHTITATFNGSVTATDNAVVQVTAGPVSAATSTVSSSPGSVEAGQNSTITVTARDAANNLLSGANVVLSADGTGNTFGSTTGTTNGSGVFTTTFKSTSVATHTITAKIDNVDITDNTTVDVVPGAPSASQSSLTVNTNTITAGGAGATVTVTVRNSSGVAIPNLTVSFRDNGGEFATASTSGSGVAQATFTSNAAGQHTISAIVSSVPLNDTEVITVQPGAPNSMIWSTQPSSSYNSDDLISVGVTVRDAFNNPIPNLSVDVSLVVTTGAGTLSGTHPVTTDGNGLAAFSDLKVTTALLMLGHFTASGGSLTQDSNDFTVTNPIGP
jgi:adhesin/invasin